MGLKTILNAFGDITVDTIEKNEVLKAQLGNWLRSTCFYVVSGFAARGWIEHDNEMFYASLLIATCLAIYSNLRTRALKREQIALKKTNPIVGPGDTIPAEVVKPTTTAGPIDAAKTAATFKKESGL